MNVRVEVPQAKVVEIEFDPETNVGICKWSDGKVDEVYVLEFVYGAQGTWARLVPKQNPSYVICVGQSGTMASVTYIVHEDVFIPDEAPIETPVEESKEMSEVTS